MNLYIIRHGNPDYCRDCLTELGHRQAEAVAEELLSYDISEIYSSPYGRAVETASHFADKVGLEINIEPWAHEVEHYGEDGRGGMTMAVQMDPAFLRSPEVEAMGDGWAEHPAFGGREGVLEMVGKVERGADDLLARQGYVREGDRWRVERENRKNIALFCHAGMFLILAGHLLRMPTLTAWHSFFIYQTSITWVHLTDGDPTGYTVPRLYYINRTDHLTKNGLPLT